VLPFARAGFGGEFLGTIFARCSEADGPDTALQFVNAQVALAFEWPLCIRRVDFLGSLGRIQPVSSDDGIIAYKNSLLIAFDRKA